MLSAGMSKFALLILIVSFLSACVGAPKDETDDSQTDTQTDDTQMGDTQTDDTQADDTAAPDLCPVAVQSVDSLAWTDLTFGVSDVQTVTLTNDCVGTADLTIEPSVDGAGFTASPEAQVILQPGMRTTVSVTATVSDYLKAVGMLTIVTNDPARPALTVSLSALASADQP